MSHFCQNKSFHAEHFFFFYYFFFIYTKYIKSFTLDTHKIHKTHFSHIRHIRHIRDFAVKIYGIHTHNKRNSPQTHDKIIPITDLRHKLSDKTDHLYKKF